MKLRMVVVAAALGCLAAPMFADLSKDSIEFGNGPVMQLLTKEEAAKWKTIHDEAEAKAFIDLFWARRDPTPDTPRNEYREEIERRIRYSDETFNREKVRGSMSDRGQTLIVFGPPARADRVSVPHTPNTEMNPDLQRDQNRAEGAQRWTWEGEDAKAVFGTLRAEIRFLDHNGQGEQYSLDHGRIDVAKSRQRAIERSIKSPSLTAPPMYASAAPQAAPTPAPAAPAPVVTELTTDGLKTAVADLKSGKNPYDQKAFASWGEYVTSFGETFVPVGLYVPKASGISGEATFFGVVEDASGKSVLAFEEPATLVASKDDFFVHKSLTLPAVKGRLILGLAQGGQVKALTSSDIDVTGALDKDATAVSPLILTNNVFGLTAAQAPTDPFAFGGLKVIPKADKTFHTNEELWYFFELRNPGLAEPALPEGTVPVNPADVQAAPKVQVKLDVVGTDTKGASVKKSAPLREADAIAMKGVPGHYGVGNAFPPGTFKPGDYTFTIKVVDTVKKASYTLTDTFKIID